MFDNESAFHAALDADPDNHAIRGVFADWLEERGDRRAHGYRWMFANGKRPRKAKWNRRGSEEVGIWDWWIRRGEENPKYYQPATWTDRPSDLPRKIYLCLSGVRWGGKDGNFSSYFSRRAAEDALAHAIADLREAGKWTPDLDAGLVAAGEIV